MYGYNNPYVQGFQPNYQNNFQQQQQQNTGPAQDERVWVSNEQAAESFLLAPSSFVRLWDSSTNRFYEKRSDVNGRPLPMDIYEYKRVLPQTATSESNVNNLPIDEINARFEEINSRIDKLEKVKKGANNAKQSNADDTAI